jgi:release factor glutamine methyltransferase
VALDLARREGWRDNPIRILDIGTGSGSLLVTLLAELPLATGLGTDISGPALDQARANAATHGVSERARFEQRAASAPPAQGFDLLVSNPPYVRTDDIAGLAPEVRDYDPVSALDGGPDGFDIYRDIARHASSTIPDGWIVIESGAGQAADLAALLCAETGAGPQHLELHRDLGGHIRCVAMRTQRILGVC